MDLIRQSKWYVDIDCPKCKKIQRNFSLKSALELIHMFQDFKGNGNLIVVYDEIGL